MGQITPDQSQQVVAALATNVDWKSIDFEKHELQNAIIRNPVRAGKQFELFLKNRARFVTGDPRLIMAKPFDPAEFLREGWTTWRGHADGDGLSGEEDIDSRAVAFTAVKPAEFIFESPKEDEIVITIEAELLRLKKKTDFVRFSCNVLLSLWIDYENGAEDSILEWICKNFGIHSMTFFGQVLRDPDGKRGILFLAKGMSSWYWQCRWLDDLYRNIPSVGCKSQT